MLKEFKRLVVGLTVKDEGAALDVLETLSKLSKTVELDKTYWVSEWSWTPISDGIYSYEEHLRNSKVNNNITAYYTDKNYRTYFPWDIYETKEECDLACKLKNSFGYDWDIGLGKFIRMNDLSVKQI
ncbi:hypothetical protein [Paenibacillus pini]|uniref:Uncharacterized protein n=1 Tax=Paenibacillus pini JCM 16418 TaxID=1236976 RepID=W7YIZ3_9BACL|nr:hypothetical protein [Paenibacillus pini]GAF10875.1 hypothetical protein JCM16418_5105 [Paenibacillus pini JCM 16418]